MKTSQKIILGLLACLISISLIILVICYLLINVVLKADSIKTWVNDSGIYQVGSQEIKTRIVGSNIGGISINNPIIEIALSKVITPNLLKKPIEQGIDSTFLWLNGDTQSIPQISISDDQIKSELIQQIVAGLRLKLNSLPKCSVYNLPKTYDVFLLNCIPPNISASQLLSTFETQFLQEQQTQSTEQLGQSTLPINQLKTLRTYYQWLPKIRLISLSVFVVCTMLSFAIIRPRYKLLKIFGIILIPQGAILLLVGWVLTRDTGFISKKILIQIKNSPYNDSIQRLFSSITHAISQKILIIGLIQFLVGLIFMFIYIFLKRYRHQNPTKLTNTV